MPASKKVKVFEGILVALLAALMVLATLKLPGFTGLSLRIILAGITVLAAVLVVIFLKSFKILPLEKSTLVKYMIVLGLLYVGLYYAIGAYTGFAVNNVQFGWFSIINFILPIGTTIVGTEIIRAKLLCFKGRYTKVMTYIIGVLSEIIIYMAVYNTRQLDQLLLLIGLVGGALTSNLLYNFVSARFGAGSIIAYRLITSLYAYIIPVLPDVYAFFSSFCRMMAPLFVYWVIDRTFVEHETKALAKGGTVLGRIFGTVTCIVMVGFIMLVSCQFSVGAIVIGSGSMSGAVDVGDVVITKEYGANEEVHEGDIIVFNRRSEKIVHRVIKINTVAGEERYYTKGDANEAEDDGYVTKNELIGKVLFRVPVVGWPTLWLREVFKA